MTYSITWLKICFPSTYIDKSFVISNFKSFVTLFLQPIKMRRCMVPYVILIPTVFKLLFYFAIGTVYS